MKKILFFILLAGTLSQACKRKDPCIVQKPTSADFRAYTIFEYPIYGENKEISTTNIKVEAEEFFFGYNPVTFEAIDSTADEYNWKVGLSDEVYTQRKFSLIFKRPDVQPGELINIQLIVKKKPNKECFPDDDGVDTVTKAIRFISGEQSPFIGRFYGADDKDPNNFYTIEIKSQYFPQIDETYNVLYGLNKTTCDVPIASVGGNTKYALLREIPVRLPDCLPFFILNGNGLATLSDDKQDITIEYLPRTNYTDPNSKIKKIFKGKRVQ